MPMDTHLDIDVVTSDQTVYLVMSCRELPFILGGAWRDRNELGWTCAGLELFRNDDQRAKLFFYRIELEESESLSAYVTRIFIWYFTSSNLIKSHMSAAAWSRMMGGKKILERR